MGDEGLDLGGWLRAPPRSPRTHPPTEPRTAHHVLGPELVHGDQLPTLCLRACRLGLHLESCGQRGGSPQTAVLTSATKGLRVDAHGEGAAQDGRPEAHVEQRADQRVLVHRGVRTWVSAPIIQAKRRRRLDSGAHRGTRERVERPLRIVWISGQLEEPMIRRIFPPIASPHLHRPAEGERAKVPKRGGRLC